MYSKLYVVENGRFTRETGLAVELLRTLEIDRYEIISITHASGSTTMDTHISKTPTGIRINSILHTTTKGMTLYASDLHDGDKVYVTA